MSLSSAPQPLPDVADGIAQLCDSAQLDWFTTVSFRDRNVGEWAARRRLGLFTREVRRRTGHNAGWLWVMEYQHVTRTTPHYHLVMGDCAVTNAGDQVSRSDLEDWCWHHPSLGKAAIEPYDASRGVKYYLSKYVSKEFRSCSCLWDTSRYFGRLQSKRDAVQALHLTAAGQPHST